MTKKKIAQMAELMCEWTHGYVNNKNCKMCIKVANDKKHVSVFVVPLAEIVEYEYTFSIE